MNWMIHNFRLMFFLFQHISLNTLSNYEVTHERVCVFLSGNQQIIRNLKEYGLSKIHLRKLIQTPVLLHFLFFSLVTPHLSASFLSSNPTKGGQSTFPMLDYFQGWTTYREIILKWKLETLAKCYSFKSGSIQPKCTQVYVSIFCAKSTRCGY